MAKKTQLGFAAKRTPATTIGEPSSSLRFFIASTGEFYEPTVPSEPMAWQNERPYPNFIRRLSELPGDTPNESIQKVQHLAPVRNY